MDIKEAVNTLESLAHETRLGVFRLLVQSGPDGLSAGDISDRMGALQNTMSSHLHKLGRAGLIKSQREGRHIIYSANFESLSGLLVYLMDDCCGGSAEVCEPVAASMKN